MNARSTLLIVLTAGLIGAVFANEGRAGDDLVPITVPTDRGDIATSTGAVQHLTSQPTPMNDAIKLESWAEFDEREMKSSTQIVVNDRENWGTNDNKSHKLFSEMATQMQSVQTVLQHSRNFSPELMTANLEFEIRTRLGVFAGSAFVTDHMRRMYDSFATGTGQPLDRSVRDSMLIAGKQFRYVGGTTPKHLVTAFYLGRGRYYSLYGEALRGLSGAYKREFSDDFTTDVRWYKARPKLFKKNLLIFSGVKNSLVDPEFHLPREIGDRAEFMRAHGGPAAVGLLNKLGSVTVAVQPIEIEQMSPYLMAGYNIGQKYVSPGGVTFRVVRSVLGALRPIL